MKQKKTTLLIVDDNELDRFLLRRAFESLSTEYRVQDLRDGKEALAYLKGEGKYANRSKFPFPGYIITDLNMWPGYGFLILDFIKLHPALSVIPIVMLSSSDHPGDIRTAYFLGVSSYMLKPETQDALQALVKKIHGYWTDAKCPKWTNPVSLLKPTPSAGQARPTQNLSATKNRTKSSSFTNPAFMRLMPVYCRWSKLRTSSCSALGQQK